MDMIGFHFFNNKSFYSFWYLNFEFLLVNYFLGPGAIGLMSPLRLSPAQILVAARWYALDLYNLAWNVLFACSQDPQPVLFV